MSTTPEPRDPFDEALDARLRELHAVPEQAEAVAADAAERARKQLATNDTASSARALPLLVRRVAAAAAVLVLAAGAAWWWADSEAAPGTTGTSGTPAAFDGVPEPLSLLAEHVSAIYDSVSSQLSVGLSGGDMGACNMESAFAADCEANYGEPLYVSIRPDRPVIGPLPLDLPCDAMLFGGIVEGEAVAIIVCPMAADLAPIAPTDGSLDCFRRVLGKLVLYEVTPRREPGALELFSNVQE